MQHTSSLLTLLDCRYEQLARAMTGRMDCSEQEARHAARDVLMALINVSSCLVHAAALMSPKHQPSSLPASCHHVPSAGLSIVALSTERAFAAHCSGNKPITWMFKSAYGSRPCPHPFLATAVSLCGACAPLQPPSALCAHSPQCHSEERKDWRRYMCSNLCIVSQTFALVDHVQHAYACTCTHDTLSNAGACHPFSS